jgi:hypothetical protein
MAISAVGVMLMSHQAFAAAVVSGFDSTVLPANDDGYSSQIVLPFSVDFYGTTYDSLFVNNNGNLTFNSGQSAYTPYGLGAGYTGQPIIAPFFADVDTRGPGSGLTSWGVGTFDGGEQTDKLNTFQVLLVDRSDTGSNNFDIVFN